MQVAIGNSKYVGTCDILPFTKNAYATRPVFDYDVGWSQSRSSTLRNCYTTIACRVMCKPNKKLR